VHVRNALILIAVVLLFASCGYKPSSHYAKQSVYGNVFVDINVNIHDPKNAVLIKDAMNEIVVSRFDGRLVDNKHDANTQLLLNLNGVSMQVLQYDNEGFENLYRAVVSIGVNYKNDNADQGAVSVRGTYDFAVDGQNEISEAKRFEAIKQASSKALEEVVSRLAILQFKKDPLENESQQ
jgi:hypothetical protein